MDSLGYLGIFVALIGLVGAVWTGRAHVRARSLVAAAKSWSSAPGRMVSAEVERRGSTSGNAQTNYYAPLVRYTYVVNGRERQGSRLRFGMASARTRGGAQSMIAPYPAGASVQVR